MWYLNGKLHRLDGPAIEYVDGSKKWYISGKLHRIGGGPAVEYVDGTKEWWVNGIRHRTDGPAVEFIDGTKIWFINGKRHREDGPAVEYIDNDFFQDTWWLDGNLVTDIQHSEFVQLLKKREKRIQLKVWLKWTDWLMDPSTERGKRFMERQYQRMIEIK